MDLTFAYSNACLDLNSTAQVLLLKFSYRRIGLAVVHM